MESSIIDNAPWYNGEVSVKEKAALFDALYLIGYTEFKRICLHSNTRSEFAQMVKESAKTVGCEI